MTIKLASIPKALYLLLLTISLIGCSQSDPNTKSSSLDAKPPQTIGDPISKAPQLPDKSSAPIHSPASSSVLSEITIAEAAKLAPSQVQDLMLLAKQAQQKQPGKDFKIIVPTYIPPGFSVESIKTDARVGGNAVDYPLYGVYYRNSHNGACFQIEGTSGGWGDGISEHQETKVFSEAMGIILLASLKSDKVSGSSLIRLLPMKTMNKRGYFFNSPGDELGCNNSIDLQEAIKIVESFQFMDSSQAKAKTLEAIEKDANRLLNKFNFPLNSCGDPASSPNSHWYPVFIDGTQLPNAQRYCRDAISKSSDKWYFEKVQVGSFTSYERALDLAKAVGGRVGKSDE